MRRWRRTATQYDASRTSSTGSSLTTSRASTTTKRTKQISLSVAQNLAIIIFGVREEVAVRPGAVGLLIGIECSRIRESLWMYLTTFVNTRIGVELAAVQRKLPDCVVVGFQLYSVRTFHVTLSPQIYRGRQGSPQNTSTPKAIQTTTQDVGYYATRGPNLSKYLCSLHHRVPEPSIPTYKPYC